MSSPISNVRPKPDRVLADIADYVTNSFSQQQGMKVVARDAMVRYAGTSTYAQRIGRELGVI